MTATATFTVELVGASCDEVTPAVPTVTEALCRDGVVGDAAVTVGPTDFITYTFSEAPPYSEGQSVTITATLDPAGVEWGARSGRLDGADRYDGRVGRHVRRGGLHCGVAGGAGGRPGDVCRGCGDGADGDAAGGGVGGGHLHGRSGWAL